ncbi:phage tailspike protein [Klebsiella quasivariicola]|uniref:phage tailspike protein n=1 Tax=Klebsiella quasivariicola TaxID=2026240 RepID=UPI001CC998D1|nr:phage tailspike protein [Klebsiella quasivariicola]MBZ9583490.1 phage head-binding domain-containing protein [Klebsiella quasivariicola]
MTDTNYLVSMPSTPFSAPRAFKSVANGKIFIGNPDTDPVNPANQIPVYVVNEDGSEVQVSQPIIINAGGFPVYNGQIMKFITKQNFSMAVYDAYGAQQFYWADISVLDPSSAVINSINQMLSLLSSPDNGKGDELVAVKQQYTGTVQRTQHDKNWEILNLLDFVYDSDIVDGIVDYGASLNRAISAMTSLSSSERAPRRKIRLPAGDLYLKTKVVATIGPLCLEGEGIYQTVFKIHPSSSSDSDYLFSFISSGWTSSSGTRLAELYLNGFTIRADTTNNILKKVFKFQGVGWDFAVENVQVWAPPLSSFDLYDTMDGTFNQLRINSGGSGLSTTSSVTHQINMINLYDSCNAIRFSGCHFENNYSGVVYISGNANNISFHNMCKFENNSRNNLVPVFQINGSATESIKLENIFISHPANIGVYWLDSNSRHLSIIGGSFMSPSEIGGYTGLRWFRIHRTNWSPATACVQLVADIDMMHVDGYGYNGTNQFSPFDFEGEVIFKAKAIRLSRPNTFIYINWNCKIDITNLTLLGAITSDYQTSLFNVAASSVKADVNVDKYNGSVAGTVYTNTAMTTASRRQSIINVRGKSIQSSSLTLSEGTDPLGYDESWTWNASGNVANIGYCHTGKRMVVRCADTSNCLVTGGNIFLPGGAVTGACTITLMAMNTSFRQGWVEISRVAGV